MKRLLAISLICLPLVAFAGGPYLFVVIRKASSSADKRKVRRRVQALGSDTNTLVWSEMLRVHTIGNSNQVWRMVSLDYEQREFNTDLVRVGRWSSNNLADPSKFKASTGYVASIALSNIGVKVFDPKPID